MNHIAVKEAEKIQHDMIITTFIFYAIVQSFYTISSVFSFISSALGFLIFIQILIALLTEPVDYGTKRRAWRETAGIILFVAFIGGYGMIILNDFSSDKLFQFVKFATVILLFIFVPKLKVSETKLSQILISANVLIFVSAIACRMLLGRYSNMSQYGGTEYFGYFQSPHMIGMGLVGLSMFQLYRWFHTRAYNALLLLLMNFAFIYLLKIRTYFFALIAAILVYILFSREISLKIKAILFIIIGGGITAALISGFDLTQLINRSNDLTSNDNYLRGLSSGRTYFWGVLLQYFVDNANILNLVFGFGLGASSVILTNMLQWGIGSHSDWIAIIIELGIFGLITYCIIYFRLFLNLLLKSNKAYILALLVAHLVSSFLNGAIYYTYSSLVFFFVLAYIKICHEASKEEEQRLVFGKDVIQKNESGIC